MNEILLGKTETTLLRLGNKKYLLCGTPLAFDEEIEVALEDMFLRMLVKIGVEEINYDKYVNTIKNVTEVMMDAFKENEGVEILYQSEEF